MKEMGFIASPWIEVDPFLFHKQTKFSRPVSEARRSNRAQIYQSESEFNEEEIDETYNTRSKNRSSLNSQIQTVKQIKTNGLIQQLKENSERAEFQKKLSQSTPL